MELTKRDLNGKRQLRIIIDLRDWWIIPEVIGYDIFFNYKKVKFLCFEITYYSKDKFK